MLLLLLACAPAPDSGTISDTGCGNPPTWYQDVDGDTFGDPANAWARCDQPPGWVADGSDCYDNDPYAQEGPFWYPDDDQDYYGDAARAVRACSVPEGHVANFLDCDDTRADVHPAGIELCDALGADEDCDTLVNDADPGMVREGLQPLWVDADEDGYGDAALPTEACDADDGFAANDEDCDDTEAAIYPAAPETCGDGLDNNCNGSFDGCGHAGAVDLDGAGLLVEGDYGSGIGWSAVALSDVDGDGKRDFALGAPAEAERGQVWIFSSGDSGEVQPTGAISTIVEPDEVVSTMGYRLDTMDANGDGLLDLVVGDPQYDGSAASGGRVMVFVAPYYTELEPPAAQSLRLGGESDRLGAQVAVGDWSGDGADDLLMGGLSGSLRIECDALATRAAEADDVAEATLSGSFGGPAALADLDGDGLAEVIAASGGSAQVLQGGGTGALQAADLRLASFTLSATVSTLKAADTDADGHLDLLAGSVGQAWRFLGPLGGELTDGDAATHLVATDVSTAFGVTLLAADENGDGTDDWLVGAYAAAESYTNAGSAYLFLGPLPLGSLGPTEATAHFDGPEDDALVGWSMASLGDLNGDAHDDLLFGAPGIDSAFMQHGGGY